MFLDWEKVARAHTHPTRIAVLEMLTESDTALSPVQIAKAMGKDVGHVGYHVRKLEEFGLVEFISERPVRGAMEHFYALKRESTTTVKAA